MGHCCSSSVTPNVAFSRETGWRGLCPAQTVTDRIVGYNAWLGELFDQPAMTSMSALLIHPDLHGPL